MTISVGGLASGLDTDAIVSQLVELERRPLAKLQEREASAQVELSAYGSLRGLLSDLKTAISGLQRTSELTQFTATVGDTDLLTASASSTAPLGSYNITVEHLAQSQKLTSSGFISSEAIGGGTLHLRVGSGATTDIAVSDTDTIADVTKAINAANAGVTATAIFDGTQYFLTLTADETGVANVINLTATDNDGNNTDTAGLSRLVYDAGVSENMTQSQAPQDARIAVDGVSGITSPSNTVSNVLEGVTLNLQDAPAAPDNTTTLTVSRNTSVIQDKLSAFVDAYNKVMDFFKKEQQFDVSTGTAGTLLGDSTANLVRRQLESVIFTRMGGSPGDIHTLAEVGISKNADGHIELDAGKLDSTLAANPDGVVQFFTQDAGKGFAERLDDMLDSFLSGTQGILKARQDGISAHIKRLQEEVVRRDDRIAQTEERLRAQFQALETTLSHFQGTEAFLNQQLAGLQNLNNASFGR
jgi:flagellar hook-associated protein 2